LIRQRIEIANQIVAMELEMVQMTRPPGDTAGLVLLLNGIAVWSHRIMEDRLRLAEDQTERIVALRNFRKQMVQLERHFGSFGEGGLGSRADVLKGQWYRMEADRLLTEAGDDLRTPAPQPGPLSTVPLSPPSPKSGR
jgi:hypothetical protein